ncbi:hypothetical protein F5887DRAFT_1166383 [Amanita rubescens]|nr:hypothetical protein F5887DRAFT_1166383 [Amanita rubescens]
MVKVTLGSVFLVLSSLSTFVFAAPSAVASYTIRNVATSNYIFSDGSEVPNQLVLTNTTGDSNTVWVLMIIFVVSLDLGKYYPAVQGKAGYYVSDANGRNLIWAKKSYPWALKKIDTNTYTFNVIGEQLYWYDDGSGALALNTSNSDPLGTTNFTITSA